LVHKGEVKKAVLSRVGIQGVGVPVGEKKYKKAREVRKPPYRGEHYGGGRGKTGTGT